MSVINLPSWPYPSWIAHRGAGKLAPENTLSAMRVGAQYGYRMVEFDVKVSSDGIPYLLHDSNLARTTNVKDVFASEMDKSLKDIEWSILSQLDVGGWHSRIYTGEGIPTFGRIAQFLLRNNIYANIEIKPCDGASINTGKVVAEHAANLWKSADAPPFLTSFDVEALKAARLHRPELHYGLLLDNLWDGWLDFAKSIGCSAVVCDHGLWTAEIVAKVHHAGMRAMSYTVNEPVESARLWALHTDGIITDALDVFAP